ncbi:hypothetical protein GBA52_011422 [Prunus armeniaca]|nr:hypothetical protein GBA52_011422 [Prunus armeniaca]
MANKRKIEGCSSADMSKKMKSQEQDDVQKNSKKRKFAGCSDTNINKKMKSHEQDDVQKNQELPMDVDTYTPELPDLVVNQILLLLPTKLAVRASTLSRQWQRLWSSLPVLNFDEDLQLYNSQYGTDRAMFRKYLLSCLKRREKSREEHDLDTFRLSMRYSGGASMIDKWLSFAVQRNVKELEIILIRKYGDRSKHYFLPQTILNAQSLTTLRLNNVKLKDNPMPISLPSLKNMVLKNKDLGNVGFVHLISGCLSLEDLSLTSCGLRFCKLLSSSLKSLQIARCRKVRIEVGAVNLESFRFWGDSYTEMYMHSSLNIASCRSVRHLEFFDTCFGGRWFHDDLSSRFPLLESLVLCKCSNFWSDTIHINNQTLKRLAFCGRNGFTVKVSINTPNLAAFEFNTGCLPSHQLNVLFSNFSLNAPNLLKADVNFNLEDRSGKEENIFEDIDFPALINFLRHFDSSGSLSLTLNEAEALIFPEERRNTCSPPLPSLRYLWVAVDPLKKVKDDVSSKKVKDDVSSKKLNDDVSSKKVKDDVSSKKVKDDVLRLRDSLQWMAPRGYINMLMEEDETLKSY